MPPPASISGVLYVYVLKSFVMKTCVLTPECHEEPALSGGLSRPLTLQTWFTGNRELMETAGFDELDIFGGTPQACYRYPGRPDAMW